MLEENTLQFNHLFLRHHRTGEFWLKALTTSMESLSNQICFQFICSAFWIATIIVVNSAVKAEAIPIYCARHQRKWALLSLHTNPIVADWGLPTEDPSRLNLTQPGEGEDQTTSKDEWEIEALQEVLNS